MAVGSRKNDPKELRVERKYTVTDEQLKAIVAESLTEVLPKLKSEIKNEVKDEITDRVLSEIRERGTLYVGNLVLTEGFKFICWIVGTAVTVFIMFGLKNGWFKVQL